MITSKNDTQKTEHLLAKKAQAILNHQQELEALHERRNNLKQEKPVTSKDHLSYEESIEFSEKMEKFKRKVKDIDIKIQKLSRELSALKKQVKRLLPVSDVKVKVSTYPNDDSANQTFCIRYVKSANSGPSEGYFEIHPFKD